MVTGFTVVQLDSAAFKLVEFDIVYLYNLIVVDTSTIFTFEDSPQVPLGIKLLGFINIYCFLCKALS